MLTDANPDVTTLFLGFREQLLDTVKSGTRPPSSERLIVFFDVLSRMFERDIDAATLSRRRPSNIGRL